VHKINTADGTTACTFTAAGDTFDRSSPVLGREQFVFIGSDGGVLYAIDAATCTLITSFNAGPTDILGTPIFYNQANKVFVGNLAGDLYRLSFNGVAFSQDWKIILKPTIESSMVFSTGGSNLRLFVGSDALHALSYADGDLLWVGQTGTRIGNISPALSETEIFSVDVLGKIYAYEGSLRRGQIFC